MILKSLAPGACTPDKSYVLSLSYVPSLLSVCRICTTIQSITTCVVLTESTVEGPSSASSCLRPERLLPVLLVFRVGVMLHERFFRAEM